MKKVFQLSELDCAACADRMETAIRKLPGVTAVAVNFVTQR
ncbi:MAG TPA: cation transporter, partial [Candidatus Limiplasma sp.]|nr:cation transporter [Candidatus Limiplasma sp.]